MLERLKLRLHDILEVAERGDRASKYVDIFLIILILLNIFFIILESYEFLVSNYHRYFEIFEHISVAIFSIEYILRIVVCTANKKYSKPISGRLKYTLRPLLIIDLLAILPFYLPILIPMDLRFLRALRLFRILRLLKLSRYSESLRALGYVVKNSGAQIGVTIFSIFILLIISSSMMYYLERDAQPDIYSSIPAAMWWGVATLTTVGYGDVYPVTTAGKVLGAIIAILGIGLFALPAGILGSGFVEYVQCRKKENICCPHCGKEIGSIKDNS